MLTSCLFYFHTDTCTRLFIKALLTIAQDWKQPQSPSSAERRANRMEHIHAMEQCPAAETSE